MTSISPILLCDGSSARLLPPPSKISPKQFVLLMGEGTLEPSVAAGPNWAAWYDIGPDEGDVVAGGAATAIDCRDILLRSDGRGLDVVTKNKRVYLPLGCVHRVENSDKVPMALIEVQTGVYVGEDDIVCYEDIFAGASS